MKITTFPFSQDDRGYGCEYEQQRPGKHMLVFTKAGAIRGRHYHKGISPTKNPEIIILISGTTTLRWRHKDGRELESAMVSAPARIEIPPFIWHEFQAQDDCAMIELNSLAEHAADTFL